MKLAIDGALCRFPPTQMRRPCSRPNVIITRSLSKSYALAGIELRLRSRRSGSVRELVKVEDSYNCDVLSLAAAIARTRGPDYLPPTRAKILTTRDRLTYELAKLGFRGDAKSVQLCLVSKERPAVRPILRSTERAAGIGPVYGV